MNTGFPGQPFPREQRDKLLEEIQQIHGGKNLARRRKNCAGRRGCLLEIRDRGGHIRADK